VPQATTSEGLAQGPYVMARVGFERATLRMQGAELTTESPHPTKDEPGLTQVARISAKFSYHPFRYNNNNNNNNNNNL